MNTTTAIESTFRALLPGDMVTVSSSKIAKPRILMVTGKDERNVYVTSGAVRPRGVGLGGIRGGVLLMIAGELLYQPTMTQQVVRVSSLSRKAAAAA